MKFPTFPKLPHLQPDQIQRLAIIGAGVVTNMLVVAMICIVWKGGWNETLDVKDHLNVVTQQLEILGKLSLAAMAIFALVVVALLGIVRDVKANLPGGSSFEVDLDASKSKATDNAQST